MKLTKNGAKIKSIGIEKIFLIDVRGEYLFEEIRNSIELGFIKDRIELKLKISY